MLRIENIVLGMCATNCYLIFDDSVAEGTRPEAVIVDPAADAYAIRDMINSYGVEPVAILLTHGHFDHILAVDALRKEYGIKAYALLAEKQILSDAGNNLSLPFTGRAISIEADEYLMDSEVITLAGRDIKVINVPGHTIGGACYYFVNDKVLISGDTLFANSVGRSDFPTGSGATLIRSIKEKLLTLPDDIKVYPGHNESTTIGFEKKNNLFLV